MVLKSPPDIWGKGLLNFSNLDLPYYFDVCPGSKNQELYNDILDFTERHRRNNNNNNVIET